jgi:hypothetical protein
MTRHRFDPLSFVVGATALAIAGVSLARPEVLTLDDLRLAGPIVLLALGLAALVTATTRGSGRDRDEPTASSIPTSSPLASDEDHRSAPDASQTDEAEPAPDDDRR